MKRQKGRVSKIPQLGSKKQGEYSIISKESGRISGEQMQAVIMTLKRKISVGTKIIPRVYGHLAVTKKPLEVRMGKGKGSISKRIGRIRPNTIIVEIRNSVVGEEYMSILRGVAAKLPVRVSITRNAPLVRTEHHKV